MVINIESYSHRHVVYRTNRLRDYHYWLLGRGSLYPYPMVTKTIYNHTLVIL